MTQTTEQTLQEVARTAADEDGCRNPALIHRLADRLSEVEEVAEKLLGDLADVFNLYKIHTSNHPDDDVRILVVGHMEASIRKARRVLYDLPTDGE